MRIVRLNVFLAVGLAAANAAAQPANDTCDTAIVVSAGSSTAGTSVGAAADGSSSCDFFGSTPDVYYQFTAGDAGVYQFDTIGSATIGNIVAVYTGCPVDFTTDCDSGTDPSGHALVLTPLSAGQTVLIGVSDGLGTGQAFTLSVSGPLPPPVNDECAAAIPLALDAPFTGDNVGATTSMLFDSGTDCNSTRGIFSVGADDVFFSFTPAVSGFYDFSTCGSGFDTVLSVHSGCPATPANSIACFDNQPAGACVPSNPFTVRHSHLPGLALDAGVTYTVRLAGLADRDFDFDTNTINGGQQGAYQIVVTAGVESPNPPANDDCASAAPITLGGASGSSIYATGSVGPCTGVPGDDQFADPFDVWYTFTAPAAGTNLYVFNAFADVAAAEPEISMALFDSCGAPLPEPQTCLATNFGVEQRRLAAALAQGETVLLRIAGLQGTQLTYTIEVLDLGPPAVNATCAAAQPVTAASFTPVDLTLAPSSLPPNCAFGLFDINALWFAFTSTDDALYRIAADSISGDADTELLILDACDGATLACASDGDGQSLSFAAAAATLRIGAGETVLIRAASNFAGAGAFDLDVGPPVPPPAPPANDDCANATPVDLLPFAESVQIGSAGADQDTGCNDPSLTESAAGIWYTITPGDDCLLTVDVFSDAANMTTTAFQGACGSLTEIGCVNPTLSGPGMIAVEAGETYHFLVHIADGAAPGLAGVDVLFDCAVIPENDTCDGAERISAPGANVIADISSALEDGAASCGPVFDSTIYSSLWYTFTTDRQGNLTVTNDLSMGIVSNSVMALYTGDCGGLTEVACANNESGGFFPAITYELSHRLDADTTYFLAAGARFRPEEMINSLTFGYTGTFAAPCTPDLDGSGTVDVFDLLAYLDLWFAGDAAAERTGDNPAVIDVFDLLVYLDGWFAGCP